MHGGFEGLGVDPRWIGSSRLRVVGDNQSYTSDETAKWVEQRGEGGGLMEV